MRVLRFSLCAIAAIFTLVSCSGKFKSYNGPEVTHIIVQKSARRMVLMHENTELESFQFDLGFAPVGHKQVEGDGRTPVGAYTIDRKNPNSKFHLSLGISYPNEQDRAYASSLGKSPGGDIFIHGTPHRFNGARDWTLGCIAVDNAEIEMIYSMVKVGTPIEILP